MSVPARIALSCLIASLALATGCGGAASGARGAGSPGAGLPGAGSPGAGSPGAGSPGAGSPGAGSPGAISSGGGVTSKADIEILDPIEFTHDVKLKPSSYRTLDSLAKTLAGFPEIELVEIGVFVLEGEDRAARQELADRRANLIYDYFIRKGIDAERLDPQGYIAPADDQPKSGVRFLILKRGPAS